MTRLDLDSAVDLVTVHDTGSSAVQYLPKNGVGEKREVNGLMVLRHRTGKQIRRIYASNP